MSAPSARLLNTIRFIGQEKDGVQFNIGRRNFAKDIIFEFLGVTAAQIYCYRDFPLRSTYEVTFMGDYLCQEAWNKCLESKDVSPISNFRVEPLFASRVRTVTVCMQNPYVKEQDIRLFLRKYCDVLGVGQKEMDYDEMWNGNRKYTVRFKRKIGGFECPPASFYIGGVKGYLYYYGQPKTCRKCGEQGHIAVMCPNIFCRNCLETGHEAKECKKPKSCNLCDSTEHMFKDCPGRHKTTLSHLRH
ncbi:zinc finger CCHC domain-containing protein 3-like [Huso huso]|uniref:Zinc finger CCHC domain-containing protein 3-like n=1 Tax=Huso huso TaxID=61971 RepID=A0ABR0Y021_HUSHU